jgi:hypothetical protein
MQLLYKLRDIHIILKVINDLLDIMAQIIYFG